MDLTSPATLRAMKKLSNIGLECARCGMFQATLPAVFIGIKNKTKQIQGIGRMC